MLEQGPVERKIIETSIRSHMPLPPKIANAPVLLQGLSFFYEAFLDLTTTRQLYESGEGPISWLAINAYCNHYGIVGEQREDMEIILAKMDGEYLVWKRAARLKVYSQATG